MTRIRSSLCWSIALSAASACAGPDEIPIGAENGQDAALNAPALGADGSDAAVQSGQTFFISPAGADANPGTRDLPWKTFAQSVQRMMPGQTLVVLDGTYDANTTGTPDVRCGVNAASGTMTAPITLRADHERVPFLKGDGLAAPFFIQGCSYWTIEGLHAESIDLPTVPTTTDAGSVFFVGTDNHQLVLRRLVGAHPNRFRESHGLRIADRSSDITVEECEIYDFNHNAFEAQRSSAVVFRRNYANARGVQDVPGGFVSQEPLRGHVGFFLEETRLAILENNVVEGVRDGFVVAGRNEGFDSTTPPPVDDPIDGNRLLGNVALNPSGAGFAVASTCCIRPAGAAACRPQNPCLDRTRIVEWTQLVDDVTLGGAAGASSTGGVGTGIRQFTSIGAVAGVAMVKSADNVGITADSVTVNALAVGYKAAGFSSAGEASWGFDHCAAASTSGVAFSPNDAHVTSPVTLAPALGGCLVYLPNGTPLKGAGAGALDVGANVVFRYQDGALTAMPLWDPATGGFPCGAALPGINADPTKSCTGIHQRLHVGVGGCPLP